MTFKKLIDYFTPSLLLRIGIAFSFFYVGVSSLFNPNLWSAFVPSFVLNFIPINVFMIGITLMHFILVVWLLSGYFVEYASLIAIFFLSSIVLLDFNAFSIVFRDVSIIFACLALIVLTVKNRP